MDRRTYLTGSASTLVLGSLAGCSGENNNETPDSTESDGSNETDSQEESDTNKSDSEEDGSDDQERLQPPEITTLELEPGRLGPDEKIPRGVDVTAIISGESPLQDGENVLRARIETSSDRQDPFSHEFTVTGSSDWTEFEEGISISTSPLVEGSYEVTVRLFDDEMNADVGSVSGIFETAAYNIRELENVEELLSELNELQKEMAERYAAYGNGDFAQVPIVLDAYDGGAVRDPLREANSVFNELDIDAPEVFEDRVDAEEAVNQALRTVTHYHEEFRSAATRVISDLDLLRDLKFDEYDAARGEYSAILNDLDDRQDELLSATGEFGEYEPPMDIEGRMDTFGTDLAAMRELDLPLENLHSATEHILVGAALSEENDTGRREARLDALSRIQSARDGLDGIETATVGDVVDAIEDLADDLEEVADGL